MTTMQIDGHRQVKAGTITNTEISATAAIALTKLANTVIRADGAQAFTANQSMGGFLLQSVATPVSGTDAANKAYVDSAVAGVDWKASVRVATTAAGTLASSFANGSTVDGVTLVTGDRILIKDQGVGSENGIYVVAASGTPTRATDADASAEVTSGMAVFVEEGTTNSDSGWMLITNSPITLGTTSLVFTQFTGLGQISAGNGLTKTGNTIDVIAFDNSIQVNADSIQVKIANASLEVTASGIRVKAGTDGQVYISNTNVATPTTLSGDVSTVTAAGAVTLASTIARVANIITREVPTGAINGSNAAYTLANTPLSGTEEVFLNGLLQNSGAGNDYTISGGTITMLSAPLTGDVILVNYRK